MKLNITVLRALKGITKKDLANMMQVSRPTIAKWESNPDEMKISELKKLCKIVGVDINEITL